jgi:hypothetical protein
LHKKPPAGLSQQNLPYIPAGRSHQPDPGG